MKILTVGIRPHYIESLILILKTHNKQYSYNLILKSFSSCVDLWVFFVPINFCAKLIDEKMVVLS